MEEVKKMELDPKIIIQSILGKIMDGKEGQVIINVVMVQIGNLMSEKQDMKIDVIDKNGKKTWWNKVGGLLNSSNKSPKSWDKDYRVGEKRGGAKLKYHITKEILVKALEDNYWVQAEAAKVLGLPDYVVTHRCKRWGIKIPKEA